jgi:hypothetical protein
VPEAPTDFPLYHRAIVVRVGVEVVFALNPTGEHFTAAQEADFEDWMTLHHGATDHELLGQYNDSHDSCCITRDIQWETGASGFVGVAGIPSP